MYFLHLFAGSGHHSEESAMCAMLLPNMPKFPLYELSCLIFFLVPMLSIAVLYVRMGLRIQSNGLGRSIEGYVHGETRQAQSRKAIIRMLSKFPSFPEHHNITFVSQENTHIEFTQRGLSNLQHRANPAFHFDRICFTPLRLLYIISCFINHSQQNFV